jgi:serine/threonine-protein kinase
VFVWLDAKVNGMFSVTATVAVPDLSGRTRDEAAQILQDAELALGDVSEQQTSDERMVGKVIAQDPKAGTEIAPGGKVAVTIGTAG